MADETTTPETPETPAGDEGAAAEPAPPSAAPEPAAAPPAQAGERSYGTGRRKSSVARVWLMPGSGRVTVNSKPQEDYFPRATHRTLIGQPLQVAERLEAYDVVCTVRGGGFSGQAGAVRHGISRALAAREPALVPKLRAEGLLTRDARRVERKKYGRPKARRSFQFSKR